MTDREEALRREIQHLKDQLTTLRKEKSDLQMAVNLINEISQMAGVTNIVERILQILVGAIGGSNIAIYYKMEGRWRYEDVLGERKWIDAIDDETVRASVKQRKFIKIQENEEAAPTVPGYAQAYETWVYPLQFQDFFFGAVRLQGMAVEHAHYRKNIDPFIKYSSLILYHEVSSLKKLQSAYDEVSRAKNELQKSKEQFELAMKFANDGLFDWHLQTGDIYYSPVWKSMLGYEDNEIKNAFSEWERLARPEDVKDTWTMINEVLEGKRDRFEQEFQMRHKDGHWVDILSRANVIFNENGDGVRGIGTHVDISKLKKIENSLRDSEEKFSRAFHGAPILMTISSIKDGRYLDVNDAFVRHTGYRRDKTIGSTSIDIGFISADELVAIDNELEKEGCVKGLELTLKKADGSEIICLYSGEVMEIEGESRLLSIALDITDQKIMEKHLRDAQKMESIGNLAGGIAHDFNNILFPVVGMSELLIEDLPVDSLERENAKEIFQAGKRGSELVKQILTFSRQNKHKAIPMRIQPVLKEAVKLLRSTIPTNIGIQQKIAPDVGMVMADPTQIHQITMNLITNAYHALERTNNGNITVSFDKISVKNDPGMIPGEYARLLIRDNGCGIAPDVLDRIFEPYFTTKAQGKGTGLGLAVVHGIIKEHNGDIRVSSEPGKGSLFQIYFPLLNRPETPMVPAENKNRHTGTERILLVDDEPSIVKLEELILERLGYQVTSRTGSLDALESFRSDPDAFDIVITDMAMPNMTGAQLAEQISSIKPDMPVILCTGFSEHINREQPQITGVKGFLMKPVVRSDMAKMVRTVLDECKMPDPMRQ